MHTVCNTCGGFSTYIAIMTGKRAGSKLVGQLAKTSHHQHHHHHISLNGFGLSNMTIVEYFSGL